MYLRLITIISILFLLACKPKTIKKTYSKPFEKEYPCRMISSKINIDGQLNEKAWKKSHLIKDFKFMGNAPSTCKDCMTQVQLVYDKQYLYIAATLKDNDIKATLQQRDTILYHDDVFEIFIDPCACGLDYYELEINALGTVWDLQIDKPYSAGGKANTHWDLLGLKKAVLKNDKQWTIELAIPWDEISDKDMSEMRMNFARVDWSGVEAGKLPNLWSSALLGKELNFHQPDRWGKVIFVDKKQAKRRKE